MLLFYYWTQHAKARSCALPSFLVSDALQKCKILGAFLHFSSNSHFFLILDLFYFLLSNLSMVKIAWKAKMLRWFLRNKSCGTIFWNFPWMFPTRHCIKNTIKRIGHQSFPVYDPSRGLFHHLTSLLAAIESNGY